MTVAVTTKPDAPAAVAPPADMPEQVFALYQQALAKGAEGVGALKDLLDLQERVQRRSAELEFSRALADFQVACPPVQKSSSVKINPTAGNSYAYTYADLEEIITTVRPHLMAHGFSFTFDQEATATMVTCICTLRHAHGHSMQSKCTVPAENKSGASAQQKYGGAMTYASRRCLINVLGLSLTDPEEKAPNVEKITDEQRASLVAMLDEVKVAPAKFCERFKIATVADLPSTLYAEAVRLLEAKRKAASS